MGRGRTVAATFGRLAVNEAVGALGRCRRRSLREKSDAAQERARAVREALESLGPFYTKVGQILSTRPDLVPESVIKELEELHDRASAAPFAQFEPVLAEELGPRWTRRFRDIDTGKPLGTASLAQVYRAVLADGTPAAVKVQRPGIRAVVESDMRLLRKVTRFAGK